MGSVHLIIFVRGNILAGMFITEFLYTITIQPIEAIIEAAFCFELTKFNILGIGGAIIAVSIVMNFLALPIYNVADAIQAKERAVQQELSYWNGHIRRAFLGDERFMMLSYYYKKNGYHPLYALRGSLSILLEIPFFIAAYHFLSHCKLLQGASFAFLHDLGQPDALINCEWGGALHNGIKINVLPILMTMINVVSATVYLQKSTLREKIQTYSLAAIFLVLLYNSPSGLVFYWILNNLFSLCKNLVNAHCKNPHKFVYCVVSAIFVLSAIYALLARPSLSLIKRICFLSVSLLFACFPLAKNGLVSFVRGLLKSGRSQAAERGASGEKSNQQDVPASVHILLFVAGAAGLAIFVGLVLPSSVISTDAQQFSFVGKVANPVYYVLHAFVFYLGLCLLWPAVIYAMFGQPTKKFLQYAMPFLFLCALANVYLFGFNYGALDIYFNLNNSLVLRQVSLFDKVVPFAFAVLLASVFILIEIKKKGNRRLLSVVAILALSAAGFSVQKISVINKEFSRISKNQDEVVAVEPIYHLSKTGKNVVILFLDRAISSYFPYILRQFPELVASYNGFTYYPNTVSFSDVTVKSVPSMLAGYEYTPEAMNARKDELLVDKHNEALLVLPRLFSQAGYSAIVTDPPFSNYIGRDDTPFKPYPKIKCDFVNERYGATYMKEANVNKYYNITAILDNCISFPAMEAILPFFRKTFYHGGDYFHMVTKEATLARYVINNFAHLFYLPSLTDATAKGNTYTFICNNLTHDPTIMKEPEYIPGNGLNEDEATSGFYEYKLGMEAGIDNDLGHYHVNASAHKRVAVYLDAIRKMGCWDNTRIIIASDHGRGIPTPAFGDSDMGKRYAMFNPLFLVKDFGSNESLRTDNTFMTLADIPFIAKAGLDLSDENPFTHKKMADFIKKDVIHCYIAVSRIDFMEWWPQLYLTNKKLWVLGTKDAPGYSVHDDIFNPSNWVELPLQE